MVASHGAFYLCAWVPSVEAWRVFAIHRIEHLEVVVDHFTPTHPLAADPFGNSLGPFIGDPAHVELVFTAPTARYITERRWHTSQYARQLSDGRLQLSLDVCIDYALKSWILSFGHNVEVRAPNPLAAWHRDEAAAMLGAGRPTPPPGGAPSSRMQMADTEAAPARDQGPQSRAQRALPFSTDWYPAPPVIVADAHGGGSSDAYDAYLDTLLREAESAERPAPPAAKASRPARSTSSRKR